MHLRKKPGSGHSGSIVPAASFVVAIPGCILATLQIPLQQNAPLITPYLSYIEPYLPYGLPAVLTGCGLCLGAGPLSRISSRFRAKSHVLAHMNPQKAMASFPYYQAEIRRQFLLLKLSSNEFAKRVGISHRKAKALVNNPDIIPRPELIPLIEAALLLPCDFFELGRDRNGSRYGYEMTKRRLVHHRDRSQAAAHLLKAHKIDNIPGANRQKLYTVLRLIEQEIEAENTEVLA